MSAGTLTFAHTTKREAAENEFSGPDGTYSMTLVSVTAPYEDESSFSKTGKAMYRKWLFAVDDQGDHDGQTLELRTSTSMSDQSKQYEVVAALIGRNPALGAPIDIDAHLVGRSALVYVMSNDAGWPKIDKLLAVPKPRGAAAPKAAAPSEPAAPAAGEDGLPF